MSAPVASPCVNVCKMDEASGWCTGCLRTLDEIAWWSQLDEEDKRAVLQQLPQRRVQWLARQTNPPAQAST
jgi:uncharacterized protein